MRLKLTVTLLIILMGLLAYIFYVDPWEGSNRFRGERNNPFGEAATDIEYISFSNPANNSRTTMEKQGQEWMLTEPFLWPANSFAIDRLLTQIRFLDKEASFRVDSLNIAETSLAEYGLDPAELQLQFGKGNTIETIEIGKFTDIGDNLYILSSDREYIHVIDRSLRDNITLAHAQLRNNRIFQAGIFEVNSWNLAIKNESSRQLGSARTRFSKTNDRWIFETPIRARADGPSVNTTLNRILNLEAVDIITDTSSNAAFGLQAPDFRIVIETDSTREVLDIGEKITDGPNAGLRYAKMEKRPTVFLIKIDFEETIAQAQTKLRDRHIFDLDMQAATSIQIQRGENEPLTLQKLENNQWEILTRTSEQGIVNSRADQVAINELLATFSTLTAVPDTGFVNDAPSAPDIESYGLKTPRYSISVTSSKIIGKEVTLALPKTETLLVGGRNPQNPMERFVKTKEKAFVYHVFDDILSQIDDDAILYQDRLVYATPSVTDIHSLKIERLSDQRVLLDTNVQDSNTVDTSALAAQLKNLRAKSFISNTLLEDVAIGDRLRPWAYKLTLYTFNGTGPVESLQLLVSELTGGPLLIGGSANTEKTFRFEQSFIDAFAPIVFDRSRTEAPPQPFATEPTGTAATP